jgi:hypothetical protein
MKAKDTGGILPSSSSSVVICSNSDDAADEISATSAVSDLVTWRDMRQLETEGDRILFFPDRIETSALFGSVTLADGRVARLDRRAPATLVAGGLLLCRKKGWMVLGPGTGLGGALRGVSSSASLYQIISDASSRVPSEETAQPDSAFIIGEDEAVDVP